MKEKKNKKKLVIISSIFIFLIILMIVLTKTSFIYKQENHVQEKIATFVSKYNKDAIVFYDSFDHKVTSLVVKDDEKYESFMFDYLTGEELKTENIIKEEKLSEFQNKIKELIYLKYPNFLADTLINNKNNVYCLTRNNLIIYFYDVVSNPQIEEELSLTVDYNEIYKYLDFTVSLTKNYENENGFAINSDKKHIAITFDDGPSKYTSSLVDILNENKAHSTFFFLGNKLLANADVIKKVANNGEEIGYHSFSHQNLKREDTKKIADEFATSNEYLKSIIGKEFTLTRPPYGSINEKVKEALDTPFILWNIDTNDWRYKNVDYLVNYVLDNVADGDIILFHDSYQTSIEAISKLLPELYVKGYQLVNISDLAKIKEQTLVSHQSYRHF